MVTGLPMKLSPLLSIPARVPSVVAGGGPTPVNRAALPPAPSSPPAHSSPPTSPPMTQNGLGPLCMSSTTNRMRREGPEPPQEAHLVTRCPPPTSCEPWQKVSPAGRRPPRGSTHCEVALRLRPSRARPPLGEGMEPSPPRPDSEASPSPHSNSLNATSLLVIDVQLVCTPAHPHFRVILSTYDITQHTITDSVKSCFQKGGVF